MPSAMFHAAEQLDLTVELSRMARWEGVRCVASLSEPTLLFLNMHPCEVNEPELDSEGRSAKLVHCSR